MSAISPQLRRAALLGALLLTAGLTAGSVAAVAVPTGGGSQPASLVRPGPGPTGAPNTVASRGRQLLYRLQGSTRARVKGGG
jgi:hypothetical protein